MKKLLLAFFLVIAFMIMPFTSGVSLARTVPNTVSCSGGQYYNDGKYTYGVGIGQTEWITGSACIKYDYAGPYTWSVTADSGTGSGTPNSTYVSTTGYDKCGAAGWSRDLAQYKNGVNSVYAVATAYGHYQDCGSAGHDYQIDQVHTFVWAGYTYGFNKCDYDC
jgi:hypothetical protein